MSDIPPQQETNYDITGIVHTRDDADETGDETECEKSPDYLFPS